MRRDIYQGACPTVLGSDFGNWVMYTEMDFRGVTLSWGDSNRTPVTSAVSHLNSEQLKWNEKSHFPTKSPDWWPLLHVLFILNLRTEYRQSFPGTILQQGLSCPPSKPLSVGRRKQGACQHLKIMELYSHKGNIREWVNRKHSQLMGEYPWAPQWIGIRIYHHCRWLSTLKCSIHFFPDSLCWRSAVLKEAAFSLGVWRSPLPVSGPFYLPGDMVVLICPSCPLVLRETIEMFYGAGRTEIGIFYYFD